MLPSAMEWCPQVRPLPTAGPPCHHGLQSSCTSSLEHRFLVEVVGWEGMPPCLVPCLFHNSQTQPVTHGPCWASSGAVGAAAVPDAQQCIKH